MSQPPLFSRILSRLFASYWRFGPVALGKWRLRSLLAPWLVARLDTGPWIRVTGVSMFEWKALEGESSAERSTVARFRELIKANDVVLDVGANIGFFALTAGAIVGPGGRVIAFEPDPGVAARASENARLNGMENVTVVATAVGAAPGVLKLHLGGWDSEGSSVYLDEAESGAAVDVPVTTLDGYLREHGVPQVSMLKIDAEGAELDILAGARELLSRPDAPAIIVEANPLTLRAAGVTMLQLRAALERHAYEVSVIEQMPWRGEIVENWLARKAQVIT